MTVNRTATVIAGSRKGVGLRRFNKTDEQNVIKRHVCNFDNDTYFGYDLSVETLDGGRYRFRFAPLTITPRKMSEIFTKVTNWTPLPLPGGPVSMELRAGETIAFDRGISAPNAQPLNSLLRVWWSMEETLRSPKAASRARRFGLICLDPDVSCYRLNATGHRDAEDG